MKNALLSAKITSFLAVFFISMISALAGPANPGANPVFGMIWASDNDVKPEGKLTSIELKLKVLKIETYDVSILAPSESDKKFIEARGLTMESQKKLNVKITGVLLEDADQTLIDTFGYKNELTKDRTIAIVVDSSCLDGARDAEKLNKPLIITGALREYFYEVASLTIANITFHPEKVTCTAKDL